MMGRREFGVAGLSAAATLAMQSTGFAQPTRGAARDAEEKHEHHGHGDRAMFDECAKACSDCQRICDACAEHCTDLLVKGMKEHAATLRTCQDCADFCVAAAQIVSRMGPFSAEICAACAVACAKCGEECEKHNQDAMMKQCADECRKCEKACREMVKHLGHGAGDKGVERRP